MPDSHHLFPLYADAPESTLNHHKKTPAPHAVFLPIPKPTIAAYTPSSRPEHRLQRAMYKLYWTTIPLEVTKIIGDMRTKFASMSRSDEKEARTGTQTRSATTSSTYTTIVKACAQDALQSPYPNHHLHSTARYLPFQSLNVLARPLKLHNACPKTPSPCRPRRAAHLRPRARRHLYYNLQRIFLPLRSLPRHLLHHQPVRIHHPCRHILRVQPHLAAEILVCLQCSSLLMNDATLAAWTYTALHTRTQGLSLPSNVSITSC